MAIALMPMDDIEDAFIEVSECIATTTFTDSITTKLMNDLLGYYKQEWLKLIGKEMFCVENLNWRTNNLCEGLYQWDV